MRIRHIIFLFLLGMAASVMVAGGASQTVALSETPVAVQKAIQARAGDGTLGEIDISQEDGRTVYEVELTAKDGSGRDFRVDEDGTLLSVEVTLTDTPAPVQKTILTLVNQRKLESIDKNLDDSETTYDLELTTKDGREKDFTIADDGTLLSAEVTLNETPGAVQKAIQTRVGDGKLKSIAKNFDDDGISYEVEATTKNGEERDFNLAADGSLSSVQVTLHETPPRVRRTIRNHVGNGKILRIDKSFVKERGIFPYEIEAQKDGKRFYFLVGPRGRFLGTDN